MRKNWDWYTASRGAEGSSPRTNKFRNFEMRFLPAEARSQPSERMFRWGACTVCTKYPGLSSHSCAVDSFVRVSLAAYKHPHMYTRATRWMNWHKSCHHTKKNKRQRWCIFQDKKNNKKNTDSQTMATTNTMCVFWSEAGDCEGAVGWKRQTKRRRDRRDVEEIKKSIDIG